MTKRNRIALTGGSGHLGTALIIRLLELDYTVKAQYNTFVPPISHANLNWVQGDVTDVNSVRDLVKDSDVIVHAAGVISLGNVVADEVYKVNVTGTENVIQICQENPQIRLIHVSSSNAVQEFSENGVFAENQPYKNETDFSYPFTKALAEQLVLKSVHSKNLNAIVVRPSSIVGAPDFKQSLMGQAILDFHNKKFPILTTGGYNIVDIRDLTQTIINGFEHGGRGEVYLLSGTYVSIKKLAKMANSNYSPILIPVNLLLVFMPLIELYRKLFGLDIPLTKESLVTLKQAPKNMDNTKAKRELNHTTRPLDQTINDLITWSHSNSKA